MRRSTPRPALPIPGPAVAALAVFVTHAAIALTVPLPGQFGKYSLAGRQLLDGDLSAERQMDFSPLYLLLHAALQAVTPAASVVLEWLQVGLVALAFGGLYALLARRFGGRLAALAVAVLAIDRHVLVYERLLEPEPLLLALTVGLLVALDAAAHAGDERHSRRFVTVAGLAGALALATRPTLLPLLALVPCALALQLLDDRAEDARDGRLAWHRLREATTLRTLAARSLLFAAPIVLVFGLLALRAADLTGSARTPVMNPGTVFFEGNNATSRGTSAIYPPLVLQLVRHGGDDEPDVAHQLYRRVARAASGEELTIPDVNAYWSGLATRQLRAAPHGLVGGLVAGGLEKLRRAVHGFRWHDVPTAWRYDARLGVPAVPWAIISALFLVGLLVEARRWPHALLFYALAASQMAVMIVFYVSARQRFALLPAVAYFGVAALAALGERRRRVLLLVLVAALALVATLPDDAMVDELYLRAGHVAIEPRLDALRAATAGSRIAEHQDETLEALATAPWWLDWMNPAYFPRDDGSLEARLAERLLDELPPPGATFAAPARFDAATLLLRTGRLDAAETLLDELLAVDYRAYRGGRETSEPRVLKARLLAARGDHDGAREELGHVLETTPDEPFALADLAALGGMTPRGDDPSARLVDAWGAVDARFVLGEAFLRHEDAANTDAAVEVYTWLIERLPDLQEAHLGLAAALARRGEDDRAMRHLVAANRIRVEPLRHADELGALARRWAAADDRTPARLLLAARVLHQLGQFGDARSLLDATAWPPELEEKVEALRERVRPIG